MRVALALASLLLVAGRGTEVEREFKKVEKRMYGPDEDLRLACTPLPIEIDDRPIEIDRSLEIRRSDVVLRGVKPSDLRDCVRGIAKRGIVDSWRLLPEGDGFALTLRLVRARRDPNVIGGRRREKSDREAAAALTKMWEDKKPAGEVLAPELLAPDVLTLREARWVAGAVTIEGVAETPLLAAGYRKLIEPLVAGGPRVEFAIDVAGDPVPPPPFPDSGLLRASLRDAPPSSLLRAFAQLDRRDFVVPSGLGTRRTGAIGGGWDGVIAKLAIDGEREPLKVGAIDVFAPKGTRPPKPATWSARRVTFELDGVTGKQLWSLLSAAAGEAVTGPDLAPLDVQLRNVPWTQALDAIALTHGCSVAGLDVRCPHGTPLATPGAAASEPAASRLAVATTGALAFTPPKPALERHAAREVRVLVLAKRETSARWIAIVETPEGFRAVVRDGVVVGLEGARASVDATGVSLLVERSGTAVAVPLRF